MKKRRNVVLLTIILTITITFALILALSPARKLRWIENADAAADARQAIDKSDFRLKGVYGDGVFVPGVDEDNYFDCVNDYGVDPIKGTSSKTYGKEYEKLMKVAISYAINYNRTILNTAPKTSKKYRSDCIPKLLQKTRPVNHL
ncbi:MAG: hypothetical protein OEV28_13815 [Nitrospirota bacterium]|nr:hypothetical protein [Nitrospirota bacterium]